MAEYNPSKIIKDGNTYNFRDTTKIPLAGSNQISGDLIPATTNAYDLGISTNKWKSLNGIAPDELGLPTSTYTDVSSYITKFDGTPNDFTTPVSGLLYVAGRSADGTFFDCIVVDGSKGYGIHSAYAYSYATTRTVLPVEKGDGISVYISKPVVGVTVQIFHLKGNV